MPHPHAKLTSILGQQGETYTGCPRCRAAAEVITLTGVACLPSEPPPKLMDDMTLADYQRGIAKVWHERRLIA